VTVRIVQTKGQDADAKFVAMSAALVNAVPRALQQTVRMAVSHENVAIASMAGPDRRLRNHRAKMHAKGGVRNQRKAAGEAAVGPKGPVAIIENGATPHMIGVGKASKAVRARNRVGFAGIHNQYSKHLVGKNEGVKALRLSDREHRKGGGPAWTTAPVLHPGMKGKGQWSRMRDKVIVPEAAKILRVPITRSVLQGWRSGR
jgi:hypothetical protein